MTPKISFICKRKIWPVSNKEEAVFVCLAKPKKVAEGEWVCVFQVAGLDDSRLQHAYGIDGFQSLLMAIEGIRVTLDKSGLEFQWEGSEKGDTGFPRHVPMFFGSDFADRISRIIDREVCRYSTRAKKRRSPHG